MEGSERSRGGASLGVASPEEGEEPGDLRSVLDHWSGVEQFESKGRVPVPEMTDCDSGMMDEG